MLRGINHHSIGHVSSIALELKDKRLSSEDTSSLLQVPDPIAVSTNRPQLTRQDQFLDMLCSKVVVVAPTTFES